MFNKIGQNTPKETLKTMERPSSTSKEKKILAKKQLQKWKKHLSQNKIKKIINVANFFGIDFYNENAEPDDDALTYHLNSKNKLFLLE